VGVLRVEVAGAWWVPGAGRRRQAGWTCQPVLVERSPRLANRARLTAAASSLKSWTTRTSPRTYPATTTSTPQNRYNSSKNTGRLGVNARGMLTCLKSAVAG